MSTVNGESLDRFMEEKCFTCNKFLGYVCVDDSYVGITLLCPDCMRKHRMESKE